MNRTARLALGVVLFAAALVGYWVMQVRPLLDDRGTGVIGIGAHANDYKHIYLGSVLLSEGESPYDARLLINVAGDYSETDWRFGDPSRGEIRILPYVYLPFTGLVLRPLALLPFAQSVVAFQFVNHVFAIAGVLLAAWCTGWWKPREEWWPAALAVGALALDAGLLRQNNAGQLNALLLGGMALLFLALVRGWHPAAVGFIAAFLMLFKLSPGIFLLWFLARREWRRAVWMTVWAGALTLLTVLLYGWRVHLDFLPLLHDMGYGRSTWAELGHTFWRDPYNQSFNALFHRLLAGDPKGLVTPWVSLPPVAANVLTWAASLVILALFAWGSGKSAGARETGSVAASYSLAVCASLLLPSIMWDHYLVQAMLPAVLLAGVAVRWYEWTVIAAAVVLACVPIRFDSETLSAGPALLLMSSKLPAVLLLFALALTKSCRMESHHD